MVLSRHDISCVEDLLYILDTIAIVVAYMPATSFQEIIFCSSVLAPLSVAYALLAVLIFSALLWLAFEVFIIVFPALIEF